MNIKEEMMKKAEVLNERLDEKNYSIKVREAFKNNGMKTSFVLIPKNDEKLHASAVIYMENMEEIWNDDDKLIEYFDDVFEESKKITIDISQLCTREKILNSVKPRFVSESNLENVVGNEIVYARYLDMLILFYVEIPQMNNADGTASYTVKLDNIKTAGITKEELYINALKNIEDDYLIQNMETVICEMMGMAEDEFEESTDEAFTSNVPMYVITNEKKMNGATTILNKKALEEVHDIMKGDFIILPSSIHECIAVPEGDDINSLKEMVAEINNSEVSPEDRLTYNIYKYSNGKIEIL